MSRVPLAGVRDHFAGCAAAVDDGTCDVRPGLRWLAAAGLLGSSEPRPLLPAATDLVRQVAGGCLASAFSVWSQTMVLEYLRCSPPAAGGPDLVGALRSGEIFGATALAPAVADLAGGPPLPVVAEPHGDGWRLTGPLRWASNLFDDAVVVTPARTVDGGRLVVLFRLSVPGVTLIPSPPLLALNGTGTGALQLDALTVPAGAVLTFDLAAFMALCGPTMLLLQAALAVGVADAALAAAAEGLSGPTAVLAGEHAGLVARQQEVGTRLHSLAADPGSGGRPRRAALRLDAMDLAAAAVRLEIVTAGGEGYRADSATSRRVREVSFLPVQAPTEAWLRLEAARR